MSQDHSIVTPASVDAFVTAIKDATEHIRGLYNDQPPEFGIVFGERTGLSGKAFSSIEVPISLPSMLLDFAGRQQPFEGSLKLGGSHVLCAYGSSYFRNERSMQDVTFAIRVMGELGIRRLIVINASCHTAPSDQSRAIHILTDHINLFGNSPLVGPNVDEWGPRFPDMTEPYDNRLREQCLTCAQDSGISLSEAIYAGVSFAQFNQFNAESIAHIKHLGADLIGIDLVPEVIAARHMGIDVLGLSCMTSPFTADLPPSVTGQMQSDLGTLLNAIATFI